MVPFRTPFFLPILYPALTWRIVTSRPELYLTFDDGPVPGPTEFVLTSLKKYNAKATFFCIGDNIKKNPEIFKMIVTSGHTLGNHTYNHINGWRVNTKDYLNNITLCERQITESNIEGNPTKSGVKLFRPPYGRITHAQIKQLTQYNIVMWDVLSQDYDARIKKEICLQKTVSACRPGSIVVFHDSVKAEQNMTYVLPKLLEHFSGKGYAFKALST